MIIQPTDETLLDAAVLLRDRQKATLLSTKRSCDIWCSQLSDSGVQTRPPQYMQHYCVH